MKLQSKSKKHTKYLTGIASLALVASAVVPVVSAADFNDVIEGNSHKEAIDALSAAGVINGYPDGSFKPNKTLTRSDVVKLMGKWLVTKGYEIPTDYKTNPRFTDLTSKSNDDLLQSAALVKDNDVFRGYENGSLNATGSITRENMAVVLVRAFDSVNKTNLLGYVAEQEFDRDVLDLNKAKVEAHTAIDVLDYYDITNPVAPNFRPKETTTRAQFASFLYKTIQVNVPDTEAPEEPQAPEVGEITSVSANGEMQLELKGQNLQVLKAEQLSIEGNELASFTANEDGTKATITLKNGLTSGKEVTLTLTVKVTNEDEQDIVTSYKFTYELEVAKVTATTTQVNANTANQKLTFNVDGKTVDMMQLTDAGYTVKFKSTNIDVFENQATGTLKSSLTTGTKFSYKVIITNKDGEDIESDLAEVKVLDFSNTYSVINEIEVMQKGITVGSERISLEDGEVTVKVLKATTLNGVTKLTPPATYKSSNPRVATVTSDGVVTPISVGEVTIEAKVGNITKNMKLTVGVGKRSATSAELSSKDSKLIQNATQDIMVTVKDQYNDFFNGPLTVESSDSEVATATVTATTDGVATVTVKALKAGSATISVKSGEIVLNKIAVSGSENTEVSTRVLEALTVTDDLNIDAMPGSDDGMVDLAWNRYNSEGFLIGKDLIAGANYTATSSKPDVATVTKADTGVLTVKAKAAGITEIQIKEGDIIRATAKITVVNSTPTISSVEFENPSTITTQAFNTQVVKPEGIKLTATDVTPNIKSDGTIFITNGTSTINLGTIAKSYSGDVDDLIDFDLDGGKITGAVKPDTKGTIVVTVKKIGQSTPVDTKEIKVNVPK